MAARRYNRRGMLDLNHDCASFGLESYYIQNVRNYAHTLPRPPPGESVQSVNLFCMLVHQLLGLGTVPMCVLAESSSTGI